MDVDNYCERLAPGLWGEPANALSNLAFLAACAGLLWILFRRRVPISAWLLPITLGVVGLCSLAFHTFATTFTGMLDSLSIAVFILIAVVVVVHWMWQVPWRRAWLAAPAFLLFSVGLNAAIVALLGQRAVLGGYLPALIGLAGFGLAIRFTAPPATRHLSAWFAAAAGIFAVSLTLRTLDEPLCAGFPLGTHFLWHGLNACVLFLVSHAVILAAERREQGA